MKKTAVGLILALCLVGNPANAQTQDTHAIGNLYTKVLNAIESQGMLNTLDPKRSVRITDMHVDHGEVFVTMVEDGASKTAVFNMIANRLLSESEQTQP